MFDMGSRSNSSNQYTTTLTDSQNVANNYTSTTDNSGNVTLNLGDSSQPGSGAAKTGYLQLIVLAVVLIAALFIMKGRS